MVTFQNVLDGAFNQVKKYIEAELPYGTFELICKGERLVFTREVA